MLCPVTHTQPTVLRSCIAQYLSHKDQHYKADKFHTKVDRKSFTHTHRYNKPSNARLHILPERLCELTLIAVCKRHSLCPSIFRRDSERKFGVLVARSLVRSDPAAFGSPQFALSQIGSNIPFSLSTKSKKTLKQMYVYFKCSLSNRTQPWYESEPYKTRTERR